jgi:probable blue pigment (indigoidine) exporter
MKRSFPIGDIATTALAPAIWGSTYLVTTEFLPPGRPYLAAVVRALPAGLALMALGRCVPRGAWVGKTLVLGTLNIGLFFFLLFVAAYRLPGGLAALIMSFQPMLVLVLAALLLRDRIRPVHVAACVLGAAGVALLVLRPTAVLDPIGVVAALAGAASMAAGIVLTKRWGRPEGVNVLQFTGWQLTAGGLVLLPAMLAVEGLPSQVTWTNAGGLAYLAIAGSLFGYTVWFRGIGRLPALAVSFFSLVSPIVATALGYIFLDQSLSAVQLLGALVVVAGIVLAQLKPSQPAKPPATAPAQRQTVPSN